MRRLPGTLVCFLLALALTGCQAEKKNEKKLADLEFIIMEKDEIPDEMQEMIDRQKEEAFQITYGDQEYLYIGQGYGKKSTSGYSIEVDECYEGENEVYIHTSLIGPGKEEEISENPTYPYAVVRVRRIEKHVVFL